MYDLIFVTQLPSFYKVNLYNEIAKSRKILVLFLGKTSLKRTPDFVSSPIHFEHVFLQSGPFETRNALRSILKLLRTLHKLQYRKLVLSGWDLPEFWAALWFSPKFKNALALESTWKESSVSGIKGFLKRIFLARLTEVYASGASHEALLRRLRFRGRTRITRGVGVMNKPPRILSEKAYSKKFLYIGRLSPEKNISLLIDVFSELTNFTLQIVGNGPELKTLALKARTNIYFSEHVPNEELQSLILDHDFLILPSLSEPWGLVVEESLYFGRPVIISQHCGAAELIRPDNGYQFDPRSPEELRKILNSITPEHFQKLLTNLILDSISPKDLKQVECYTDSEVRP